MKFYAHEVDDNTITNPQYLERWQEKFGSIYRKLAKCKCINCEKSLVKDDSVHYVACHSGVIKMWHDKCEK